MSTQTPNRNTYDDKGLPEPLVGDGPPQGYDNTPAGNPTNPLGNDEASGDYSDPRDPGGGYQSRQQTPYGDASDPRGGGAVDRGSLGSQEAAPASGSTSSLDGGEQSFSDRLGNAEEKAQEARGLYREEGARGLAKGFTGRFAKFNRKRMAVTAVVSLLGGGGLFAGTVISGPVQTIHMAKQYSKHFNSLAQYGEGRTSKVLLYALIGQGAQNGRLGITGNIGANKWEARLLEQTGMRPVYGETTRRFVGFEIVDDNKARQFLGEAGDQKGFGARRVEQSFGKGAEIRKPKDNEKIFNKAGDMDRSRQFVDLSQVNFADRRAWIRTIGKATDTNRLFKYLGSRLLIKRAGVSFHTMNKAKRAGEEGYIANKQERRAKAEEERRRVVEDGNRPPGAAVAGSTEDANGNEVVDPGDQEISSETNDFIDDFKKSGIVKSGASAAAVVGVLCVAKAYGDSIEDYKFANNVMPMLRMGMDGVSKGSQIMAMADFDLETLGEFSRFLYDEETNTSWSTAESVRAEQGKPGGIPMPAEASLGTATQKPLTFRILDGIPALGGACGAIDAVSNLPVIKELSSAIGAVAGATTDAALAPFGTSTEKLVASSMKAISGRGVDALASGADYGNMANTGTFLAANDQAIAAGGTALSEGERTQLAQLDVGYERQDQSEKSFAARYFDPLDEKSAVSSVIDSAPSSPVHAANMFANPVKMIGSSFSALFTSFTPQVSAQGAPINYDYGVPKFGTSIETQKKADFDMLSENPYKNASEVVEKELDSLNEKYGKCFGMTVTAEDDGVHILTADKSVDAAKIAKDPDCNSRTNTDDKFNHYSQYVGDAVVAVTLACDAGNAKACDELGVTGNGATEEANPDAATNPNIVIFGDSLTVGMKDAGGLESKLAGKGWEVSKIEATEGDQLSDVFPPKVQANKELIEKAGTVVFALGTNKDNNFQQLAEKTADKVKEYSPRAQIFWVNAYSGKSSYTEINKDISAAAASKSMKVIDFAAEAKRNPDKYPWGDPPEIHHTPEGYKNKAGFIVKKLGAPPSSYNLEIKKISPLLSTPGTKIKPTGITLHWWGGRSNGQGIDNLANTLRSRNLSVQLGITAEGEVYQMTKNLTDLTSHAIGANSSTIGIEIEGLPEDFGKEGIEKYPEKFEAVVATVQYLMDKYDIPATGAPTCGAVKGVHPHSAYNNCAGAVGKDDVDDYYFKEVLKRVR